MPYSGEHSCRFLPPETWKVVGAGTEKSGGKAFRILLALKKGSSEGSQAQAFRYPLKNGWTESEARAHCKEHKGILFEPATGKTEESAKEKVPMTKEGQAKLDELIEISTIRHLTATDKDLVKVLVEEAASGNHPSDLDSFESRLDTTIAAFREAAVVKTEEGAEYPASAFAYVPDSEKPSTWKLRLWEDTQKKVTRGQLGRAAAALSPGGFRGNRVEIPRDDLGKVKAKIRGEYRKLDVADEDIPRWVKEAEMRARVRELGGVIIEEAAGSIAQGIVPIRILQPGFNADRTRFYTDSAMKDAVKVFDGIKMYVNHQTGAEEAARPEGNVWEWVANLKNPRIASSGAAVADAVIHDGRFKEKVKGLQETGLLEQLGISIRAVGQGSKTKMDGVDTQTIEAIVKGRSVDFVTEPNAGGRVGLSEGATPEEDDVDVIGEADLRKRRPDLVTLIEAATKQGLVQEVNKIMEDEKKTKELEASVAALTTERDGLKTKIEEAQKAEAKATAQKEIADLIGKADLPEPSKIRIKTQFAEAIAVTGVAEAVAAETKYIAELNEAGKIKGMGKTDAPDESQKGHEALVESMKRLHPEYTKEQLEIAVKGR